jgi:hydrogenase-4 component B
MQYTSGSFAGIASGWFRWLLQPEHTIRKPRGHFPAEAMRLQRIPETILDHVVGPVGTAIMKISNSARRLQHGRVQFYILYVLGGLIVMGIVVSWGGGK